MPLRFVPRRFAIALAFLLIQPPFWAVAQSSRIQWEAMRQKMVDTEIVDAGVEDRRVVQAMRDTPRHEFVPLAQRKLAYFDMALPIGSQQTISPPFVVAYMTEQLDPQPSDRVLEIGTGSGYQAAVLSRLVSEVYTIEIVPELARRAERVLRRQKLENVKTRTGDGYLGWPEAAPFDKIIVTCSPENPPKALVEQLAEGGRMVIPVGERYRQNLYLMKKVGGKLEREALRATLFVPMTGEAEENRERLPDGARPRINNGSFEAKADDETENRPAGWHYLRQAERVDLSREARGGVLRFTNKDPGRSSQALQGFAVDGRRVDSLDVSFEARGEGIRFGQKPTEWPYVVVTFYDQRRASLVDEAIGPLRGDFPWTEYSRAIPVPVKAREAIVRLGLLGAVGQLEIDDVSIRKRSAE